MKRRTDKELHYQNERKAGLPCVGVACASNNPEVEFGCEHGASQILICHGYMPEDSKDRPTEQSQ